MPKPEFDVIPEEASQDINRYAHFHSFDQSELDEEIMKKAHPSVPVVEALVQTAGPNASGFPPMVGSHQSVMRNDPLLSRVTPHPSSGKIPP